MDLSSRLREKKAHLANYMLQVGHHSPEARAVQTFMRALDGWSADRLGSGEMLVLAHQGAEDWLRSRLVKSHWDPMTFPELVALARSREVIDRSEAFRLTRLHRAWQHLRASKGRIPATRLAVLVLGLIEFIERRW